METKDYISKHKLLVNETFDHSRFITDMKADFICSIDKTDYNSYNRSIRKLKNKIDEINKITNNKIPKGLWDYFYATFIVKIKSELFPIKTFPT